MQHDDDILSSVPDVGRWDEYVTWFGDLERRADQGLAAVSAAPLASMGGADLGLSEDPSGRFGIERFRRFLGAVLAADWLTYKAPDDRANLLRLAFVLDRFPKGFRVWFLETETGWMPVGYSGWYPIDHLTYERLEKNNPPWRDRAIVPMTSLSEGDFLYLFNYSILPTFRKGDGSRRLIKTLASEVSVVNSKGMAAITVSDDGSRVAGAFGLSKRSDILVGESPEQIWTSNR